MIWCLIKKKAISIKFSFSCAQSTYEPQIKITVYWHLLNIINFLKNEIPLKFHIFSTKYQNVNMLV